MPVKYDNSEWYNYFYSDEFEWKEKDGVFTGHYIGPISINWYRDVTVGFRVLSVETNFTAQFKIALATGFAYADDIDNVRIQL